MKTDILDGRPDNRQATGLGLEDVNLIGALSHEAKETFDSIRRLNVTMQDLASRRKTLTNAPRPQPNYAPLPR